VKTSALLEAVSKTVQDARINSFLSAFPGQQPTQDDLPVAFCQNELKPCSNKRSPEPAELTLQMEFK
jgi:hypothetical protein